jgi:CRP-like cAMP-binding protein
MALLLPGDLSGLASRGLYVNSVRTLTDSDVLKIPLDALKAMLLRNASLHFLFLCKTAHMIRESQRQILLLSRNDPVERLALLISTLRDAPAGAPSNTIPMPAAGREIASYLDLSPSQVSRALDSLVTAGVVHYGAGMLRVINPRKLQRIVDHASGGTFESDERPPRRR